MFIAHAKREAVDRIHAIKNSIVSGLWSNSNLDEENVREQALDDINQKFDQAILMVYEGEAEIDPSDPFFAAMKVPEIDPNLSEEQIRLLEERARLG